MFITFCRSNLVNDALAMRELPEVDNFLAPRQITPDKPSGSKTTPNPEDSTTSVELVSRKNTKQKFPPLPAFTTTSTTGRFVKTEVPPPEPVDEFRQNSSQSADGESKKSILNLLVIVAWVLVGVTFLSNAVCMYLYYLATSDDEAPGAKPKTAAKGKSAGSKAGGSKAGKSKAGGSKAGKSKSKAGASKSKAGGSKAGKSKSKAGASKSKAGGSKAGGSKAGGSKAGKSKAGGSKAGKSKAGKGKKK